jgi:hypothetical protein
MNGRTPGAVTHVRSRLDRWVFPVATPVKSSFGRTEAGVVVAAVLALAVVLQVFRVGPSLSLNAFWAEDGTVFFQGALFESLPHAVTSTYAGYLVVVQRLFAEVGGLVPLEAAPAAVALTACVAVAVSGLAVWVASAGHIHNPYLRATLAAVTVLAPVASLEAIAAGSYAPWYMLFATFWLLLWRPETTLAATLAGLFILLTALSSPGVWYFAPIVLLRLLAARDRRDALILAGYGIGTAIQLPVTLASTEGTVTPVWTSDIWAAYAQRVVDGAVLGEDLGGQAWAAWGWPFLIALLAALGIGLVAGLLRTTPSARCFAALAIPTSIGMFAISTYQRAVGSVMMWQPDSHSGLGGRYAIVPALLLISVALVLIDRSALPRRGAARLSWLGVTAALVLGVGIVTSFSVGDSAVRGTPSWDDALETAAATCPAEPPVSGPEPTPAVASSPTGFVVYVPCNQLQSFNDAAAR